MRSATTDILHETTYFPEQDRELVEKSKKIMKELLGVEPLGYRAPEAILTEETIKMLWPADSNIPSNTMACDWPCIITRVAAEKN